MIKVPQAWGISYTLGGCEPSLEREVWGSEDLFVFSNSLVTVLVEPIESIVKKHWEESIVIFKVLQNWFLFKQLNGVCWKVGDLNS